MLAVCITLLLLLFAQPALASAESEAESFYRKAIKESCREQTLEQSVRDLDEAIKRTPGNANLYLLKASVLYRLEEDESALQAAKKACELSPDTGVCWLNQAQILCRLKKLDESLKCSNRSVELMPKDTPAYRTRAEIYYIRKQFAEAEADLDTAIKLDPKMIVLHAERLKVCEQLKKWPKVLADCTYIIDRQAEKNTGIMKKRAEVYKMMKKYDLALDDLKRVARLWPDDMNVHKDLANLYRAMGDKTGQKAEEEKIDSIMRDLR